MKPKMVALLQSNYIPWKGYFDIINSVDEFILYDECQYTKNDWRNRNAIRTSGGTAWLTIPVRTSGRLAQTISETEVADGRWAKKHWQSILTYYGRAPFFKSLEAMVQQWYETASGITRLSKINHLFITAMCDLLGIETVITWSSDYPNQGDEGPTERILSICRQTMADVYLSGPSARNYLREELFDKARIGLTWIEYEGYPEYRQMFEPTIHTVSILDLIFNVGPDEAPRYMKSFG